MVNLKEISLKFVQFLKVYSVAEVLPHKFPVPYQVLPETREFNLYEWVYWRGEKWCVVSIRCTCYEDCRVWKLELERYPCKYSSHKMQYVDSREVKKVFKCGEIDES